MTDNEKKFKAAFMALLDDFEAGCFGYNGGFCEEWCPFKHKGERCPFPDESFAEDYTSEWKPLSKQNCGEKIFNWYLENGND